MATATCRMIMRTKKGDDINGRVEETSFKNGDTWNPGGHEVVCLLPQEATGTKITSATISLTDHTSITGTGSASIEFFTNNTREIGVAINSANVCKKLENKTQFSLYFYFKGSGSGSSASYRWDQIYIEVTYEKASPYSGVIKFNSGTYAGTNIYYSFPRKSIAKGEDQTLSLAITPSTDISSFYIDLADSNSDNLKSINVSVNAHKGVTTFTTVSISILNTSNAFSGDNVREGYIRARISSSASNWYSTNVNFVCQRTAPIASAGWSEGGYTNNSNVTKYIAGYSDLVFRIYIPGAWIDKTADPDNTIISRTFIFNDQEITLVDNSTNKYYIGIIRNAGTYTYSWSATDSYNKTVSGSGSITLESYTPPVISSLLVKRCIIASNATVDIDTGTNLRLTLTGSINSMNGWNRWNVDVIYAYDLTSTESTYHLKTDQSGTSISISNNATWTSYLSDGTTQYKTFSIGSNWPIKVIVSDCVMSVGQVFVVSKYGYAFNIEQYGVAVGKKSTANSNSKMFEVDEDYTALFNGDAKVKGSLYLDFAVNGTHNYYDFMFTTNSNATPSAGDKHILFVAEPSS